MRLLKFDNDGGISFTNDLSKSELRAYKYAILSHTWGKDEEEVKYDDVLTGIGTSKPGSGSKKIRFCIRQARQHGLEYFWVDTCCIDKRNNTELTEALNSMFQWYLNAEKCYVFLEDVCDDVSVDSGNWEQDFCNSRWFKRGWTLQELIAPSTIEFYSSIGQSLGTKSYLEKQINDITHIPIRALRNYPLSEFTIHERLQWQEGRETKKEEDMVYSLLGLLEVSLPAVYGIGEAEARRKLDVEIATKYKGVHHEDFSLSFSLNTAFETQNFVARENELREIRTHLSSDGSRKTVVLHGLGGIGKTQLAITYAKRYRHDYSALLWLNAKDEASMKASFTRIAKQILNEHPSATRLADLDMDQKPDEVLDAVKAWFSMPKNTRWLMICDNYDNPKIPGNTDLNALDLHRFLPEPYHGVILITTRSSQVQVGHRMHITKLRDLQDGLRILEASSSRQNLSSDPDATQLARKLDGLPLALATAGAYLSQTPITFKKYLNFWEQSWAKLQMHSPALNTYEYRTLFSTWQVSFDQIERRNILSAKLLRLWAYLDNQDLWFELLNRGANDDFKWLRDLAEDEIAFHDNIRVLCEHGLVEANARNDYEVESKGYSVHVCVHSWMLAVLNAQQDHGLAATALRCVALHVPTKQPLNWSLVQRRLLNHANKCSNYQWDDNNNDYSLTWAFSCLADLYHAQGKLAEAEVMYMRALRGYEKALGADHTSTLHTVHNLGNLYSHQGKLAEAEEMYTRALQGKEKALGADHTSTLNTVHSLGLLYRDQGKLVEAEEMYMRALRGYKKALGADHTSTLNTVNNLGLLYSDQDKLAEAEVMYMRAVGGYEKALGADHTSTLQTVHNLGNLYSDQGKLGEAKEMYMRALEGKEKALGADHTSTLHTIHSLGLLYSDQGKLAEAEEMYMRALRGYEKALGADHTSTLQTVNNLGNLYSHQGKLVEAEVMYMRALRGCEKALGADHTSTLDTVNNLGLLYRDQGKLEMYMRALRGKERALGADHTSTLNTVHNLGFLYSDRGKLVEAEELYMRAIRGYEKTLGADHTSTLHTVSSLGILYCAQGKTTEGERCYRRAKTGYDGMAPGLQYCVNELGRLLSPAVDNAETSQQETIA
ncbi:TPR-like protein [Polychaeton citri CBS 116435]|uniref:TPR-like protein n=1 Tax=Polychaeton citri CBS 116435 TaxID=1314669 RepID=A0A9P4QF77_9PEZI|nr:TPR-like protein [Polychaeton citri CBS 116435]